MVQEMGRTVISGRLLILALLAACSLAVAQDAPQSDYAAALKQLQAQASADPCDEDKVLGAMAAMLAQDPVAAARDAIALLPATKDLAAYYGIVTSLGEAWSKEAVKVISANIRANSSMEARRDLVVSLMLNEYAAADAAVIELLKDEKLPEDIRAALVEETAKRKLKPAIPILIELFKMQDGKTTDLGWSVRNALVALTGNRFKTAAEYAEWWKANAESWQVPGARLTGKGVLPQLTGTTVVQYQGVKASLKKEDIVVVPAPKTGGDKLELVLPTLELPHTVTDFSRPKETEIKRAKVIIVSDDDGHWPWRFYCDYKNPGNVNEKSKKTLEFIASRVEAGAYLVTTDACLVNVLIAIFGGFSQDHPAKETDALIEKGRQNGWRPMSDRFRIWPPKGQTVKNRLRDSWTDAELEYGRDPEKPTPANLSERISKKIFRVEWVPGSWFVDLKPNKLEIEVIALAPEWTKTYGFPIMGFTFRHGRGRILHLMGEVSYQFRNDRYPLDKLLTNFILEGCERFPE
jgi:hypothetical protein